jgi:Adenylate and Guanylate cyclase catalytic domain
VMFCDLVDSTGIAARLDAEEWRDLVGAYLGAASAAVAEMGGKVAKKLGDGLMALFGHPVAQENDAERAVRAALAIQRALAEMNRKNGAPARFSAYCGKWLSCSARGEMKSDKIQHLPRGINCIWRSYAALGKFSHAWRCVGEAMTAA